MYELCLRKCAAKIIHNTLVGTDYIRTSAKGAYLCFAYTAINMKAHMFFLHLLRHSALCQYFFSMGNVYR